MSRKHDLFGKATKGVNAVMTLALEIIIPIAIAYMGLAAISSGSRLQKDGYLGAVHVFEFLVAAIMTGLIIYIVWRIGL